MGMPRGLIHATAYYNKLAALEDWRRQVDRAARLGRLDLVAQYVFNPLDHGWRYIDKRMADLRHELDTHESIVPPAEIHGA